MRSTIRSHLNEGDYRKAMYFSVTIHVLLLLFATFGVALLPSPPPIQLGLGEGGGQGGDTIRVGLAADLGGGEGMVKPAIEPRPEVISLPERKEDEEAIEPDASDFVEKAKKQPRRVQKPEKKNETENQETKPGVIPQTPEPGAGGSSSASGGSGGGFGTGRGVQIGSGSGEGNIDSWYIRQVERKVGQNWLRTSLGNLKRVRAIATFEVSRNGRIQNIELNESSGVRSVDLAVQRAIQASDPLPSLPAELRGRVVRFQAIFEYPPR